MAEPGSSPSPLAGAVLGQLLRTDRALTAPVTPEADARAPADRVAHAFATVAADLDTLARELHASGQAEPAHIVEATVHIALDPELRQLVDHAVAAGDSAESAIQQAIEHFAGMLAQIADPTLAARAADVRAVGRRLVAALASNGGHGATRPAPAIAVAAHGARAILVAQEITADDLLVHSGTVAGAATVLGSATSHAGIVARSLGVPMVFGTDPAILDVPDGIDTLLDPSTGEVVLNPDPDERRAAHR
jgi:multiphosphoryl transfer protein